MAFLEQQLIAGQQTNNFVPAPDNYDTGQNVPAKIDSAGNLSTRSESFTDAGSFRYDFEGTALTFAITGTLSFSNSLPIVTGVGTSFLSNLLVGQYIKLVADSATSWRQIESIESDTLLTLNSPYTSNGSGTSEYAWASISAGTGATITNANSFVTMNLGTTASVSSRITRTVDYPAVVGSASINISQRIANQDIYIGFSEQGTPTPKYFAWFRINGTTANSIILETCGIKSGLPTAADIETQTVNIPSGLTTANTLLYRIEVKDQRVRFFINDIQVGTDFRTHIPSNYDILGWGIVTVNGITPATNTVLNCDFYNVNNANEIAVYNPSLVEGWIAEQPVLEQFLYNQAGVIAINTDLLIIDCSQYKSLFIQCTSMGTTGVVTPQWTDDPAVAVANRVTATLTDVTGAESTTFNAAVKRVVNVQARFFVLRLTTATTAGTTTIYVNGSQGATNILKATQAVSGTVSLASNSTIIPVGSTAQGAATYSSTISNATNSLTQIKSGATTVNSIHCSNKSTNPRYLKIFNALSASVTMGTTNANLNFIIPANGSISINCGTFGIRFATGFTIAITADILNNDNTSTGTANEVIISTTYF